MLLGRILPCSSVYCNPPRQQEKRKDSLPQAPGFCAEGIFIFALYFDTDSIICLNMHLKKIIDITHQRKQSNIYAAMVDMTSQV